MAQSFDISNEINEVTWFGDDAPQNGASQPHSPSSLISSAAHPQAAAEIQPGTTAGVPSNSENPSQAITLTTSVASEVFVLDADPAETVAFEWADDDWPGAANYQKIDDTEELAHNLLNSGLVPHSNPRIEALFRRAASGKGYHSQLIRASGLI
ncbi:MAG: hypothetical protein KIT82_04270 [Bradyrhizobium sp.]|nr:hypothetical protein [Bradyrhizobium sp.]